MWLEEHLTMQCSFSRSKSNWKSGVVRGSPLRRTKTVTGRIAGNRRDQVTKIPETTFFQELRSQAVLCFHLSGSSPR